MSFAPEYVAGTTTHARRGAIQNRFSYNVDFVLIDPEANETGPRLFSRNARNLAAVHDIDHGGLLGQGRGAAWGAGRFCVPRHYRAISTPSDAATLCRVHIQPRQFLAGDERRRTCGRDFRGLNPLR